MTAIPSLARVGEVVSLTYDLRNLGSVGLDNVVFGGGTIAADGQPCGDSVSLPAGTSTSCTDTHLVTTLDVAGVPPVLVRSTGLLEVDSDNVDDDPTSTVDVDASSGGAPFVATAASVEAASSLTDGPTVWLDGSSTRLVAATATVSSAGRLTGVVVDLPERPVPGLVITSCDRITAGRCLFDMGTIAADTTATVPVTISIAPADLAGGGLDALPITGRVLADGGVNVPTATAHLSTAGAEASIATATVDGSADRGWSTFG